MIVFPTLELELLSSVGMKSSLSARPGLGHRGLRARKKIVVPEGIDVTKSREGVLGNHYMKLMNRNPD